jgi:DNA polymerase/3'-5' exonuclease PolX
MGYLRSKQIAPTNADVKLVEQLETLTKEPIEKINKFFANNWSEYRKKVESTPLKTFKDYLPIGEGK